MIVDQLLATLQGMLQENIELKHILNDKSLAKLGDALINFVYSISKSLVTGTFSGEKVSDSALAEALRNTSLRKEARTRSTVDDLGDSVEAFCAYLWISKIITIEEMVGILSNAIKGMDLSYHKHAKVAEKHAFIALINELLKITSITQI